MKERRVVITGMGVTSATGNNIDELWKNLIEGNSGVCLVEGLNMEKIASKIAAQIKDFDPGVYMDLKIAKRMDRFAQFAVASAKKAVEDSGITIDSSNEKDAGVYVGSGVGGLWTIEEQHTKLLERGADRVSPFLVPMIICNMASAQVSIMTGSKGPVSTTTTACAAGSNAIGDAFEIIKRGAADIMFAGGSEAPITYLSMAGFSKMNALSRRNDDPKKASRPFDRDRDGFVMGEGSGILVLEELEHALSRNAKIYCEIFGYGLSGEAFHMTALEESGENVARCMLNCLDEGGVGLSDVDYVNAHGTSTPLNDVVESVAIKRCFGKFTEDLNVSSTKSVTGHCLGAAGAVEAIATILAINNNIVPPTINLDNVDERCEDLNFTPNKPQSRKVDVALSNSMGFGGHNVTLGFKRFSE